MVVQMIMKEEVLVLHQQSETQGRQGGATACMTFILLCPPDPQGGGLLRP